MHEVNVLAFELADFDVEAAAEEDLFADAIGAVADDKLCVKVASPGAIGEALAGNSAKGAAARLAGERMMDSGFRGAERPAAGATAFNHDRPQYILPSRVHRPFYLCRIL